MQNHGDSLGRLLNSDLRTYAMKQMTFIIMQMSYTVSLLKNSAKLANNLELCSQYNIKGP
jgi:hypothetical protein